MGGVLMLPNCWSQQFMDHEVRGNHTWYGKTEFGKRVIIQATPPEIYQTNNHMTIQQNVRSSKIDVGRGMIYSTNSNMPKSILKNK